MGLVLVNPFLDVKMRREPPGPFDFEKKIDSSFVEYLYDLI